MRVPLAVPCLDVEGVVEFKTVHSKDHPDEVAESLSAYDGGRLVTGIEIMSTSINTLRSMMTILIFPKLPLL